MADFLGRGLPLRGWVLGDVRTDHEGVQKEGVMFEEAVEVVFGKEGGFSLDSKDRGGATMYGVTEAVARANGYAGAMELLSKDEARRIAKAQYWDVMRLDEVEQISDLIALELFDTGYNMGVSTAAKFLQRCLNALNREAADYPDVEVDGVIGPMTVRALELYTQKRGMEGEAVLVAALNILQGSRYIEIAENDVSQERFVYGWLKNRV